MRALRAYGLPFLFLLFFWGLLYLAAGCTATCDPVPNQAGVWDCRVRVGGAALSEGRP